MYTNSIVLFYICKKQYNSLTKIKNGKALNIFSNKISQSKQTDKKMNANNDNIESSNTQTIFIDTTNQHWFIL